MLKSSGCILVLAVLNGCLYPHTTLRSWEVKGRVLDARAHAPIHGAKIFLTAHPKISTTSDSEGRFRLKETHNFHLVLFPPEGSGWPPGDFWWPTITVSHSNYVSREIGGDLPDKGDVFLEPEK
jgi:hypothetical protein